MSLALTWQTSNLPSCEAATHYLWNPKLVLAFLSPHFPTCAAPSRRVIVILNEGSQVKPGRMASSQSMLATGFPFYHCVFLAFSLNTIRFLTFRRIKQNIPGASGFVIHVEIPVHWVVSWAHSCCQTGRAGPWD